MEIIGLLILALVLICVLSYFADQEATAAYKRGFEDCKEITEKQLDMSVVEARRCLDAIEDALINRETIDLMQQNAKKAQRFHNMVNDSSLEESLRNRENAANKAALTTLADNRIEATKAPVCGPTFRQRMKIIGESSYANIWQPRVAPQAPHNSCEEQAATLRLGGTLPGKPTEVDCLAADPRFVGKTDHTPGCEHSEREDVSNTQSASGSAGVEGKANQE